MAHSKKIIINNSYHTGKNDAETTDTDIHSVNPPSEKDNCYSKIEFHPFADTYPILPETDLKELSNDITENGLKHTIVLFEEKILDGRNRYLACLQGGIEPIFTDWNGTKLEAVYYVRSVNGHRRHLSPSQAAASAVLTEELLNEIKKEAKEVQGTKTDMEPNLTQRFEQGVTDRNARTNNSILAKTSPDQTNRQYIADAKKIKKEAPKILEKVKDGILNIPEAKKVIQLKPESQEQVFTEIDSGIKPKKAIRKAWDKERSEIPPQPLPAGQYDIIYADPPWKYDYSKSDSRKIENQYPTMELEEIKSLQVPTAENSILFLWATAPKLREAMEVMESWGFTYKTNTIWDKQVLGMGYYARNQHEILLIGTKGNFSPPHSNNRVSSVYREKRTEHSKKPDYYYGLIESMYPGRKYLELFAIGNDRKNWTVWGLESVDKVREKGDTILNTFVGGGTTGVAAVKLDRLFIGSDLDKGCVDKTKERLEG